MARDCKTAAVILEAIAGKDMVNDPLTADIPFGKVPKYAEACSSRGLRGARLGKLDKLEGSSDEGLHSMKFLSADHLSRSGVPSAFVAARNVSRPVWSAFNQTFDIMRDLGADVQLKTDFAALDEYLNIWNTEVRIWLGSSSGFSPFHS